MSKLDARLTALLALERINRRKTTAEVIREGHQRTPREQGVIDGLDFARGVLLQVLREIEE